MKKNIFKSFLASGLAVAVLFGCTQEEPAPKNEISTQGWTVKAPDKWQIAFHSLDRKTQETGVIVTSPNLNDFHSGQIKKGIYLYYEPREWPHDSLHGALQELKSTPSNFDVKLITVNSKEWLLSKTKNENGDLSFARTGMGTQKYIHVRGQNLN